MPVSTLLNLPPLLPPLPLDNLEVLNVFKLGIDGADMIGLNWFQVSVPTIRCLLSAVK